jgi:hypothetical protein
MNEITNEQYEGIVSACRALFLQKLEDYGTSWRHFRLLSIIDQIFIKAKRIRRLEELGGMGQIPESVDDEYVGIINYSVIALDKMLRRSRTDESELEEALPEHWSTQEKAAESYAWIVSHAKNLLLKKNHDYGEAWRDMAVTSLTDEILGRTERIKHLLSRRSAPAISEGVESQLWDTLNYAVLALVKIRYPKSEQVAKSVAD